MDEQKKELAGLPALKEEAKPIALAPKKETTIRPTMIDRLDKRMYFSIFGDRLKEMNMQIQLVNEMVISDMDQYKEAELRLRVLKDSIDYVENMTKTILYPYKEIVTECTEGCGEIVEKIKTADTELRQKIINFQKNNYEKENVDIAEKYNAKRSEIEGAIVLNERVNIICKQLYARLNGGLGPKLDGTTGTFPGVQSEQDCEKFIDFVNDKFPDASQYGEFSAIIQYAKDMGIKIAKFKRMMFDLKNKGENIHGHEGDLEKMYNAFNLKTDSDYVKAKATLERKLAKVTADQEKELKVLLKGIIYKWDFVIDNSVMVPEQFKSVDDKKVKDYISTNKELLESKIKKNTLGEPLLMEQPIPGIIIVKKETKRIA